MPEIDLEPGDFREKGSKEPIFKPYAFARLAYVAVMFVVLYATYWIIASGVNLIWPYIWPG